jgi:glycine dehydrogenase subunit 1
MNYLPHTDEDRAAMLARIGVGSIDELFAEIPAQLRLRRALDLPPALDEVQLERELASLARANGAAECVCFLGGGMYDHFIPAAERALLGRGEFLTAYTPYQPEVSQGTLQFTFEFQTAVCELTGMDVANASMYDGSTAAAEAALLTCAVTGRGRVAVARSLHPEYREVLRTYARGRGIDVVEVPWREGALDLDALRAACTGDTAAVLVGQPNFFGVVEDVAAVAELAHGAGALAVVVADPSTLGVLEAPGRQGADVVCGDAQPLGIPLSYGGPTAGYFAVREAFLRRMPGRIAGLAHDAQGRRGFVLTLQAREQHIRRARATSNICTNQALFALAATIYLTLLGPEGLREAGELCRAGARYAASLLSRLPGVRLAFGAPFFKEFAVLLPPRAEEALAERGLLVGPSLGRWYPELEGAVLVAVTEKRTRQEIERLAAAVGELVA